MQETDQILDFLLRTANKKVARKETNTDYRFSIKFHGKNRPNGFISLEFETR